MERLLLSQDTKEFIGNRFLLDLSQDESICFPDNFEGNILVNNIGENINLHLYFGKYSNVSISILNKEYINTLNIDLKVKENSHVDFYFADFSKDKENIKIHTDLEEKNAELNFHLASLSANNDDKIFDVSVSHKVGNTFARVDNYGVCKDNAKLLFSGVSHILNGSVKSKTYQSAKVVVFDQTCCAIAKPILKIDENDIEANHAAVVGKINDEHMFYLTSRGLTENIAKELITYGYLKPILAGFIEEDIKNEISSLIERKM